jgi:putative ABC transport system permease protein
MVSVYTTLSIRYLRRRWFYALLMVASIAAGVSLLVATQTINDTMARAAKATATPLSGAVDVILSNNESPIDQALAKELHVAGIASALPRIFEQAYLLDMSEQKSTILLVGLDMLAEQKAPANAMWKLDLSSSIEREYARVFFTGGKAVVVGKALDADLGSPASLRVISDRNRNPTTLSRVGTVDASGPAASLGGNVLIVDLATARAILGFGPGKVSRVDLAFAPGNDPVALRAKVTEIVAGRADVRTPQEQNQAVDNVMSGMQVALLLCGIAALVVGLFLVYNTLSVAVAERRHEIGVLLSVGATRGQIRRLFGYEAALLGLVGSILGIPLGVGFAILALEPVRGILQEIFFNIHAAPVQVGFSLIVSALAAGVITAVLAGIIPAMQASRTTPAEAVRRMPVQPAWSMRTAQIVGSVLMLAAGSLIVYCRNQLPDRLGMYAGLALVVIASLLATPLITAALARALQPAIRVLCGLEVRLAADNLVRYPGRTGIVIAALAAGVALFVQTAGAICSNRSAIRQWVEDSIAADLCVTSGSPVSAGGGKKPMSPELGTAIEQIPGVERAMGVQIRKPYFRDTQILMLVLNATDYFKMDAEREARIAGLELYRQMADTPDTAIVSDNFAARHDIRAGDTITLTSPRGPVRLKVLGQLADYSWNHGTIFINKKDHDRYWDDPRVDVYDVYLYQEKGGWEAASSLLGRFGFSAAESEQFAHQVKMARKRRVQEEILRRHGAELGLFALTREELHDHIDGMIERLFGIAYGQQFVVLFVAALGVVTALLISVLQRRRELGLLRAIGASRAHVLRCVLAESVLMGLMGSAIGLLVGIPLEWFALHVVIVEETGYFFPLIVPWRDALLIATAAVAMATLAGIGPALFATAQRIPEAIAVE